MKTNLRVLIETIIYAVAFLAGILIGLTCFAQTASNTTVTEGESCGCTGKPSRHLFACYPDCGFLKIESTGIPGTDNELVRIAPASGYDMDVKFYFENEAGKIDSLTYLNTDAINFNYNVCQLYFFTEDTQPMKATVKWFKSIVVINHRYGPHPNINRIIKQN